MIFIITGNADCITITDTSIITGIQIQDGWQNQYNKMEQ